mgnify:CR=1 FL=1
MFLCSHLCDEGRVAGDVVLPHGIILLHRPFGEPLLRLGLVLGQLWVPRVLAWRHRNLFHRSLLLIVKPCPQTLSPKNPLH